MASKLVNMPEWIFERLRRETNANALIVSLIGRYLRETDEESKMSASEKAQLMQRTEQELRERAAARHAYKISMCTEALLEFFEIDRHMAAVMAEEWLAYEGQIQNIYRWATVRGLKVKATASPEDSEDQPRSSISSS